MIRRFAAISVLVGLGTLLVTGPATAAPVETTIDGIVYQTDANDVAAGATIVDAPSPKADLVIPSEITVDDRVYEVTAIGDSSFSSRSLTSVVIPDSVTTLGSSAFNRNELTTVTIGSGITRLGTWAFGYNNLTSITIPDTVTNIGHAAFIANNLTSISIPDSVTTIEKHAFQDNSLSTVTIPDSVKTLGINAFHSNKLTDVAIGSGITTINTGAFAGNSDLTDVTFKGDAPSLAGDRALGDSTPLPTVTYFDNAQGFATPTWNGGAGTDYPTHRIVTSHTVSFDNGGSGATPDPVTVAKNGTVANPGELSEPGYTFVGWFTALNGGAPFDFSTRITGNLTLYAEWIIDSYTVRFDVGNSEPTQSHTVEFDAVIDEPATPTRDGHTFTGWFDAPADGTLYDFGTPITGDLTLYAQWQRSETSLSYPTETSPGSDITVAGTGFAPGEELEMWLLSTPVHLGSATADADGTFSTIVTIPADLPAGDHRLEIRGADASTVSNEITIVAAPPATDERGDAESGSSSVLWWVIAAIVALAALTAIVLRTTKLRSILPSRWQ